MRNMTLRATSPTPGERYDARASRATRYPGQGALPIPLPLAGFSEGPMGIEDASIRKARASTYLYRAAASFLRAHAQGSLAEKAARSLFGTDPVTAEILKAATGQATTTTTGWAAELARMAIEDMIAAVALLSAGASSRAAPSSRSMASPAFASPVAPSPRTTPTRVSGSQRAQRFQTGNSGSEDTELGVLMELEVCHGETEVYPRVQ